MNWLSKSLALMAVATIVATAGMVSHHPAHAQVDDSLPPLADLSIVSTDEFGRGKFWTVDVKNNYVGHHPGVTVITVKVNIPLSLDLSTIEDPSDVEALGVSTNWTYDDETGVLTIRNLRPGETARFRARSPHIPQGGQGQIAVRFYAEIIETEPAEPPGFQFNNATEHWFMGNLGGGTTFFTSGDTAVAVQVSDPTPEVGGQTTFTVHAGNLDHDTNAATDGRIDSSQLNVQVQISLSPGLNFSGTQQAPDGTRFQSSTGIWDIGTLGWTDGDDHKVFPVAVSLTNDSPEDLPLEKRCLTAKVVRAVPWFAFDHSKRENDTATVCLGEDPKVPLTNGKISLFYFYPCVGVTSYPCTSADTLELVARAQRKDIDLPGLDRVDYFSATVGGTNWLQPETVVTQAWNPSLARGGVRMGTGTNEPFWSTEGMLDLKDSQTLLPDSVWSDAREDLTVTGLNGEQLPGSFTMRFHPDVQLDPIEITDTTKVIGESFGTGFDADVFLDFGGLGTYVLTFDIRATHNTAGELTDSGVYTFHAGPISELEVRDAGANRHVAANRRAYTIEAVNHGPDAAPVVEVMLTGVPEGAEATPDEGRYIQVACQDGLCESVWTIGELEGKETARATGKSPAATLTIIAEGDPITATIENTQDYSVVINGTTHSTNYYDYVDDNNTATVSAHRGTGVGHPDAPRSLRLDKFGSLALLRWQPVERVNGLEVTHYQVERNGINLAEDVGGTMYADIQGGAVNQSYRVRAVNIFGVPGPWSWSKGASGRLQTEELDPPNGLTATPGLGDAGRIDLSWFAPSTDTGLRYIIEHATDGAGPWTTLAHGYSGTTYSHTGAILLPGTTHYYRVATAKGNTISAWAYAQATMDIGDGVAFYVPGWPENLRFTSVARTSVTLAWDPPVDDGGTPVTGYEYRVFGPCASGADAVCDVKPPTRVRGTSVSISGLNREGTYQFEVRALNAVGAGDWSPSVQKHVGPQTARGGRIILSPSSLTVPEGGEATYRVRLSSNPTLPVWVVMHWDGTGNENLGAELPFQQFKILLPTGYDTAGLPEECGGVILDWKEAYAWNAGAPITVMAAEDDANDEEMAGRPKHASLTIQNTLNTLPRACLNLAEADWSPDPVYDGMGPISLTVTERDND